MVSSFSRPCSHNRKLSGPDSKCINYGNFSFAFFVSVSLSLFLPVSFSLYLICHCVSLSVSVFFSLYVSISVCLSLMSLSTSLSPSVSLFFVLLFYYSCPNFPFCPHPPSPRSTPTVNLHTIVHVHGSFIHVPSFYFHNYPSFSPCLILCVSLSLSHSFSSLPLYFFTYSFLICQLC